MGRSMSHRDVMKQARAKRDVGLRRKELDGAEPVARIAAAGATSAAVKVVDPNDRALIDDFLAARRAS